MKIKALIVGSLIKWGVEICCDKAYKSKIRSIEMIYKELKVNNLLSHH